MIAISKIKYPELDRILLLKPNPHVLLGKEIYWTVKEDGSNIGAYLNEKDEVCFRSRNMDEASEQFYTYLKSTDEYEPIRELLLDARQWNDEYVIFGELLVKGKSPTRIQRYDRTQFIVFDIWSNKGKAFYNYTKVHQECYHFGLPIVELLGTCRVSTIDKLLEFKDTILEKTKGMKKEGCVGKTWFKDGFIYFKEKHDTPMIERLPRVEEDGKIILPILPDSEIYGAIEKARTDLGSQFKEIKVAMPVIAKYISDEAKKHNCQNPKNLFNYYQQRLKDLTE